jgi:PEP-CTERM motif
MRPDQRRRLIFRPIFCDFAPFPRATRRHCTFKAGEQAGLKKHQFGRGKQDTASPKCALNGHVLDQTHRGHQMRLGYGLAICAMAAGLCAASSAQASLQMLTVDFNQYASAVDTTPGEVLATMTVKDLATGGVSVEVTLDDAIYFASTGGPHITLAFDLGKSISFSNLTFSNPLKSDFTFALNKNAGSTFGTFSDGINGTWNGTSNHFAGPIDFTIAGLQVSDFTQNAKGYWGIVDVLGSHGTGEAGGNFGVTTTITSITPSVPEPSTWAMLLLGFAGLGYAGFKRARKSPRFAI